MLHQSTSNRITIKAIVITMVIKNHSRLVKLATPLKSFFIMCYMKICLGSVLYSSTLNPPSKTMEMNLFEGFLFSF